MRHSRILLAFVLPILGYCQINIPESANVNLYFPHFADGGPPSGQWQTRFTFVNPTASSVNVSMHIIGDNGSPLNMDFGSGPTSYIAFTIPSRGTRIYRSQISSPVTVTGWASGHASGPILATVAFREIVNGVATVEITAQPTLPSPLYLSAANSALGIAVANAYNNIPISVSLTATDSEGNRQGQRTLTVPVLGHVSFNLRQQLPNLPVNFTGSIALAISPPSNPANGFLAWTVNADTSAGTISSLPEGRVAAPTSQYDRIWMVANQVFDTFKNLPIASGAFAAPTQLNISPEAHINAFARNGQSVQIDFALAELISDSPSELAFVVAHELGHIYQQRTGKLYWGSDDVEWDADYWGLLISLYAGYDPYAAAGALAKLGMATGTASLASQLWEDFLVPLDPHASFSTRIDNLYNFITTICSSSSQAQNTCARYKTLYHPHFPTGAGSPPLNESLVLGIVGGSDK